MATVERMPFKLARPNPSTGVTDASEIDFGIGANKRPLDDVIDGLPSLDSSGTADFYLSDSHGNVLALFRSGNFQTKNFDSGKSPYQDASSTQSNLDFTDENGNVILRLISGNIKTRAFDSTKTPSQKVMLNDCELEISDENNNVIAQFYKGEFRTLNFSSEKVCYQDNVGDSADFEITDPNGNVIFRIINGHIVTKSFNSQNGSESPLKGKRVAFLGDSITQGTGATASTRYSTVFSALAGCTEHNLGVAGDTIGLHIQDDMITAYRGGFYSRASQVGTDDFIFVFGGTNDFTYNPEPIGDYFGYETIATRTYTGNKKKVKPADGQLGVTFAGALHELILRLRSTAPNAQIVFISLLSRCEYSTGRPTSAECNSNGDYIQDYNECIRQVCEFYCIPVIPLGQLFNADWAYDKDAGHTKNQYSSDGIHPNVKGHRRIAEILYRWVQTNIVI